MQSFRSYSCLKRLRYFDLVNPYIYGTRTQRVNQDPINPDCILIFDWMSIKKSIVFNKYNGSYEGFVNLGENVILCGEEDAVASEALVFIILSALRANWKYPIG